MQAPLAPSSRLHAESPPSRRFGYVFVEIAMRERLFLALLGVAFFVVGSTYQHAEIARWVGFALAGYSAVANDSIQTIGTFLASNQRQKWWLLWIFIAGLFVASATYSWLSYDGDVSFQRLQAESFNTTPQSFTFLQVAAPLFLLILTRMRVPVSTTFLLLTSFATSPSGVGGVLTKSLMGYVLAFGIAIAIWLTLSKVFERWFQGRAHPAWYVLQWISSGTLWVGWLMQDASNVAVYLPRSLSAVEFIAFVATIALGLGLLMRMRGERIQEVVNEKSAIFDVRGATIIDFVYAAILFYFKMHSKMPMSTTWVFIGLLGGRELAMAIRHASRRGPRQALRLIVRDVGYVSFGLAVSIALAMASNAGFADAVLDAIGL